MIAILSQREGIMTKSNRPKGTTATQINLDRTHRKLLESLASHLYLNMTQTIMLAIRELAKREKVE